MREFKFRIWDKRTKKMIGYEELVPNDVSFFSLNKLTKLYRQDINYDYFGPNPDEHYPSYYKENLVLMQYTGEKDSDKKEVYEGDILQWKYPENGDNICVVKWISESEGWDYSGWMFNDVFNQGGPNKIIGNIFENSDLLKNEER